MKRSYLFIILILTMLVCACTSHKESERSDDRNVYVHYLNEYWTTGEVANIDSALKYNAYLLKTDSANIADYLYRIQMLDICGQYDSVLAVINTIPQEMVAGVPKYKACLRLKCKAVMAHEAKDTMNYRQYLDSIIGIWEPALSDSIAKGDSLFARPIDSIPSHLLHLYADYYEVVRLLAGKDLVERILTDKKKQFNWNSATYEQVKPGDGEPTLP